MRRNEDERRGASPSVESAGIRALGSTVFVVLMALGGTASVCFEERRRAGDWDALEGYSQVEPEEAPGRRARIVSPCETRDCLFVVGRRFCRTCVHPRLCIRSTWGWV
jgi:hypothetical protein